MTNLVLQNLKYTVLVGKPIELGGGVFPVNELEEFIIRHEEALRLVKDLYDIVTAYRGDRIPIRDPLITKLVNDANAFLQENI